MNRLICLFTKNAASCFEIFHCALKFCTSFEEKRYCPNRVQGENCQFVHSIRTSLHKEEYADPALKILLSGRIRLWNYYYTDSIHQAIFIENQGQSLLIGQCIERHNVSLLIHFLLLSTSQFTNVWYKT
jgi:hypothetical protein